MKNSKIQKFQEELEKNEAKMAALKGRGRELEQKIREAETLEIFALMRNEKLTMDDLLVLARSRKENDELPSFADKQSDVTSVEADDDAMTAMDAGTGYRRDQYKEDEDDEDEDDE